MDLAYIAKRQLDSVWSRFFLRIKTSMINSGFCAGQQIGLEHLTRRFYVGRSCKKIRFTISHHLCTCRPQIVRSVCFHIVCVCGISTSANPLKRSLPFPFRLQRTSCNRSHFDHNVITIKVLSIIHCILVYVLVHEMLLCTVVYEMLHVKK